MIYYIYYIYTYTSDLSELRNKEAFQQIKNEDLSSQTQNMISLNLQLQNSVMKAQSKAVELELKKLDLSQSEDHLKLLMVSNIGSNDKYLLFNKMIKCYY